MELFIRPYVPADLDSCRALWVELTQHHRDIYEDPYIGGSDPGSGFDRYLARPSVGGVWVAEHAGAVVGLTGLLVDGASAEIEPVVVASSSRGRGVGAKLVHHVIDEARARDVRTLRVQPVARNRDAIAFFVSLGFDTVGHLDLFQDLQPSSYRTWKTGLLIQGHELKY